MLSRFHCYIIFEESINSWVLYDGCYNKDSNEPKPSTNGTWIYIKNDTEITNHLIFKANHTVFKCHILQ